MGKVDIFVHNSKAWLTSNHSCVECYRDDGGNYRGKVNVTREGLECTPWHIGGYFYELGSHNHCRNPGPLDHGGVTRILISIQYGAIVTSGNVVDVIIVGIPC